MILKTIIASTLLVWSSGGPGAVQEIRIAQVGGETEIVVVTSGEVTYRDFALEEPPRLILDLSGAETGLPNSSYDAIRRGGVMRIRSSWFRPGVLRLVFDLAEVSAYDVRVEAGRLRITFPNLGGEFEAWSTTTADVAAAAPSRQTIPVGQVARLQEEPSRITVSFDSASMGVVPAGFSLYPRV